MKRFDGQFTRVFNREHLIILPPRWLRYRLFIPASSPVYNRS